MGSTIKIGWDKKLVKNGMTKPLDEFWQGWKIIENRNRQENTGIGQALFWMGNAILSIHVQPIFDPTMSLVATHAHDPKY